jgi:hypothetical protein
MKKVFAIALTLLLAMVTFSSITGCKKLTYFSNDTTPTQTSLDQAGNSNTVTETVDVYERTTIVMTVDSNDWTKNSEAMTPLETPAMILAGRTMIPLRAIVEGLGGTVEWDSVTKTIYIALGQDLMAMIMNNPMAYVNGIPVKLDYPPTIIDGRTLIPVRFVAEYFGCEVLWDEPTRTVTLIKDILQK